LPQHAVDWGVDVIAVAATTSNVLSTGVDVYVPSDRLAEIRAEVERINLSMGLDGRIEVR